MQVEQCIASACAPARIAGTDARAVKPRHSYMLAPHAFACIHDNNLVLLDLREDKYLSLSADAAAELALLVGNCPPCAQLDQADYAAKHYEAAHLVEALLERGLLTPDHVDEEAEMRITIPRPAVDWTADVWEPPTVHPVDILRFVRATLFVSLALRYRTLEKVIQGIAKRHRQGPFDSRPLDAGAVTRLVGVFAYLRPYFTASKDACLFESLALHEFLYTCGYPVHIVFGVRTGPFAAHCWLQRDAVVVNDAVDSVSRFTPIMVV